MTDTSTTRTTRAPLWTIWDVLTAISVALVSFAIAMTHQEALWVCLLSGGIVGLFVFLLQPLVHRLSRRR